MAIQSVTSTAYAPQQLRTDQTAQASQMDQARQAAQTREAERMAQSNQTAQAQAPQPVVNAQGQVTGKIVNTIA